MIRAVLGAWSVLAWFRWSPPDGAPLLLLLSAGIMVATSCDDSSDPAGVPVDAVLVAIVRDIAVVDTPSTTEPGPLSVVYVVSIAEDGISAGAQADVASELRDEVDVRFADQREEALDDAEPDVPVVDGGVLLVVGDDPRERWPRRVPVEVYRNAADWTKFVFSVGPVG